MEFKELINKRTCIRAYDNTPVTDEQIHRLLDSAIKAPNACNFQSWHFYVVKSKDKINAFHPTIARIPWIENITCLIVVAMYENVATKLTDRFGEQGRMFVYQDAAGAINHILLSAADMGLGGCWVGPMQTQLCKEHLNMPDNHTPLAIVTVGTPAADTPKRDRKPLSDVTTYI